LASSSVSLNAKLKITGINVAKGIKAINIPVKIDAQSLKDAKAKVADAFAKLTVRTQIDVSGTSINALKKKLRDKFANFKVNVGAQAGAVSAKAAAGGKGSTSGTTINRQLARSVTMLTNFGNILRDVNRGMRSLRGHLQNIAQIKTPRGGAGGIPGGGGGGGGLPPGGGGGGAIPPGFGGQGNILLTAFGAPALQAQIDDLSKTIITDLRNALVGTGKAASDARDRLVALVNLQQQLQAARGQTPQDAQTLLVGGALKNVIDETKRLIRVEKDAKNAFAALSRSAKAAGRKGAEAMRQLDKDAKMAFATLGRAAKLAASQAAASMKRVDQEAKAAFNAMGKAAKGAARVAGGQLKEIEALAKRLGVSIDQVFAKIAKSQGVRGGALSATQTRKGIDELNQAIANRGGESLKTLEDINRVVGEVGRKAAIFRIAAIAINTFANAIRGAGQFLLAFDAQLRDINKILRLSSAGMRELGGQITALAASTGVAVADVGEITEELARAGLAGRGLGSILELTNVALKGVQGTSLDAAKSIEVIVQLAGQLDAGAKGLNKELVTQAKVFDVLGRAEDITASKAEDVQAAFKRSGATLLATGATIEQVTTLFSVLQERTRRGGEVIGTAFKTIGTRIANPASRASKALRDIGVEVVNADGTLRNIFDVLQDTSLAFENLTEAQQANIAATVAGLRQAEIFRNITGSAARQQAVLADVTTATGDAARKQAEEQQKLANILTQIQNKFLQLVESARAAGLGELFKTAASLANNFLGVIVKLNDLTGGRFALTVALGGIATALRFAIPVATELIRGMLRFANAVRLGAFEVQKVKQGLVETDIGIKKADASAKGFMATLQGIRTSMFGVANASKGISAAGMAGATGPSEGGRGFGKGSLAGAFALSTVLVGLSSAFGALKRNAEEAGSTTQATIGTIGEFASIGGLLGATFGPAGAGMGALAGAIVGAGKAAYDAVLGLDEMKETLKDIAARRRGEEVEGISQQELDKIGREVATATDLFRELSKSAANSSLNFRAALSTLTEDGQFSQELGNILGKSSENALRGRLEELFENALGTLGGGGRLDAKDVLGKFSDVPGELIVGLGDIFEKEFGPNGRNLVEKIAATSKFKTGALEQALEKANKLGVNNQGITNKLNTTAGEFLQQITDTFIVEAITKRDAAQAKAQAAARRGLFATQFEFGEGGLGASFEDLKAILNETDDETKRLDNSFFKIRQAFKEVNSESRGFNKLVDLFRTSIARLSKPLNELRANTLRLQTPLKELAIVEARIAIAEAERAKAAFALERTAALSAAERDFGNELQKAGLDITAIEGLEAGFAGPLQDAIQKFVNDGVTDVGEITKRLGQIGVFTAAALEGLSGPEAEQALKKFIDAQVQLREQEVQVGQKALAARQAVMRALESEISILDDAAKKNLRLVETEQLRASIFTSQLTGLDAIIAKEQELVEFGTQRIAAMDEELAGLKALAASPGRNADERERLNDQILQLERELTNTVIDQVKKRNALQRQALESGITLLRKEAQFVSKIASGRNRLVDLLRQEERGLVKFNTAIARNQAQFTNSINVVSEAIRRVSSSTLPAVEKEKMLAELRQEAANLTLEAATAEAELLAERRGTAEQIAQESLQNQAALQQAQQQAMEASKALSNAIFDYKDAVQGVIAATTEYNVQLRLAGVEAVRIMGGFRSVREEMITVSRIFRSAEQSARLVGAGEKIIADLRKQSITQQIALFERAIQQQASAAEQFFGSSRASQAELFKGIQAVKALVSTGLFGDSFDDFRNLGAKAINDIGAELLSLPESTRQQILRALDTLKVTGAQIGGFTADEIRNAINTAAFGATEGDGATDATSLVDLQTRLADLTEEQARLQLDALIAANEQISVSKEQLSAAQANRDLAQIQIDRIREEGIQIRGKLTDLTGRLETPILQQTGVLSQGFLTLDTSLNGFAARLETAIRSLGVSKIPLIGGGGGQTTTRIEEQLQPRVQTHNAAEQASFATANKLVLADSSVQVGKANTGSNVGTEGGSKVTNELLKRIEDAINDKIGTSNEALEAINARQEEGSTVGATAAAAIAQPLEAQFNINIEGQQQVRVTGITEGINTAIQQVIATFGPFVTEGVVREQIVQPILDSINKFFISRGLPILEFT
jgi:TP901 family phage tail tape measure protein